VVTHRQPVNLLKFSSNGRKTATFLQALSGSFRVYFFQNFNQIYRTGSVVAAADELCLTQSGVSQHLQKLENKIGVPLFTRLHKKMIPTTGAQNLYTIVSAFVDNLSIGNDLSRPFSPAYAAQQAWTRRMRYLGI